MPIQSAIVFKTKLHYYVLVSLSVFTVTGLPLVAEEETGTSAVPYLEGTPKPVKPKRPTPTPKPVISSIGRIPVKPKPVVSSIGKVSVKPKPVVSSIGKVSVRDTDALSAGKTTTSIWPNGKAYLFNGSQYVRYDPKADKADPGYPAPIAGNWPGFPPAFQEGIDAEVVWNHQTVYFFKGDQYLRYDIAADRVDPGYPLPIAAHWPGLWMDHIDAGVVWPNGKAYFFSGSQYVRYDIATDKADPGYPADIKGGWPGFPASFAAGIDDVVVWNNGKAYFFKGNQYIRYDIAADKTDPGYPQPIAANWRGLGQ